LSNDNACTCVTFTADAELAAMADDGGSVRIWNIDKRERLGGDLPAHQKDITDLVLTPDKKVLVTASEDGEVKVWDLAKRQTPVRTFPAHTQKTTALAVSPDGTRLVTAGADHLVKAWEIASGKELRKWEIGCRVRSLAFMPDGKQVATANGN